MFLSGFINEALEPIIENLSVAGLDGPLPINAILDTGFNGMVCLLREFESLCKLTPLGLEMFELADGTIVNEVLYVGRLVLNDSDCDVELSLTDSNQALLGMQLLLDRVATFNLRTMRIEVI